MLSKKFLFLMMSLVFFFTFVNATEIICSGSETFGMGETECIPLNFSDIVINEVSNNSIYWDGNAWDVLRWILSDGSNPLTGNWNVGGYNLTNIDYVITDYIFGNGEGLTGVCLANGTNCLPSGGGGGNPFNQSLNTTDNVTFNEISLNNYNVSIALANSLSSSLIDGGIISINGDNTLFDLSATTSWFVNNTDMDNPNLEYIVCPAFIGVSVTQMLTSERSDIALNRDCTLTQKATPFDNAERRSKIVMGRLVHPNNVNIIATVQLQHYGLSLYNQYLDLTHGIGNINTNGNVYSASGSNLSIQHTSGKIFRIGANYQNDKDNPNEVSLSAVDPIGFFYRYQDGSGDFLQESQDTTLNVNLYDDGSGILQSVGNNKYSVQRVYLFSAGQTVIQYGQAIYNKLSEATASISTEDFNPDPNLEADAVLRAWIVVKGSATDLTDTSESKIINAGKFGSLGGGTGTSASQEVDLQNAYDNSLEPEIVLDSTHGAFTIQDAETPLNGNLFEVLNGSGTDYIFNVTVNGLFTPYNVTASYFNGDASLMTNIPEDTSKLSLTGGTMSGSVNWGGQDQTNIDDMTFTNGATSFVNGYPINNYVKTNADHTFTSGIDTTRQTSDSSYNAISRLEFASDDALVMFEFLGFMFFDMKALHIMVFRHGGNTMFQMDQNSNTWNPQGLNFDFSIFSENIDNIFRVNASEDLVIIKGNTSIMGDDLLLSFGDNEDGSITWDGTNLVFDTNLTGNGEAYFSGVVNALNFTDRTVFWDESRGSSLDAVKDSRELRNADGSENDSLLDDFDRVTYLVVDRDRPVNQSYRKIVSNQIFNQSRLDYCMTIRNDQEFCDTLSYETVETEVTAYRIVYPYQKEMVGRSMSSVIGKHEQNIYDLIQLGLEKDDLIANLSARLEIQEARR